MAWKMSGLAPGSESSRHRDIKRHIYLRMALGGWSVEEECSILSRGTKRADLAAEDGLGRRVAIEVQVSDLDLEKLQNKLDFYTENGIGTMYVVDESLIAGFDANPIIGTIDGQSYVYRSEAYLIPEACSFDRVTEGTVPKFAKALNACGFGKIPMWLDSIAMKLGIQPGIYLVHVGSAQRWVKPFKDRGGYYGFLKRRSLLVIGPRIEDWSSSAIAVTEASFRTPLLRADDYIIAGFPVPMFWRSQHNGG